MKFFVGALLLCSAAFVAVPVAAQEYQGCFMRDDAGRLINLSAICPGSQTSQAQAQPQEDLRPIAYASAYCDARKDGYPRDVSSRRAIASMQEIGIHQAGSVDAYWAQPEDGLVNVALATASQLCPGL